MSDVERLWERWDQDAEYGWPAAEILRRLSDETLVAMLGSCDTLRRSLEQRILAAELRTRLATLRGAVEETTNIIEGCLRRMERRVTSGQELLDRAAHVVPRRIVRPAERTLWGARQDMREAQARLAQLQEQLQAHEGVKA